MAGLVPAIGRGTLPLRMAGTSPAMTVRPRRVDRYDLLTFQNTGAGPFSGSLMRLLHAARGR